MPSSNILDAGIIATAQRVEHYEMAGYGTVQTFAKLLGEKEAAELFTLTLNEEKAAASCFQLDQVRRYPGSLRCPMRMSVATLLSTGVHGATSLKQKQSRAGSPITAR
jgi:hypothetical protein